MGKIVTVNPKTMLAGFEIDAGKEPFENHVGPFYRKFDKGGRHISAFITQTHPLNGNDRFHGGMIMAFADYALFVIAHDLLTATFVTISCQTEFLKGSGALDKVVFSDGEVTRATRSLIFIKGRIYMPAPMPNENGDEQVLATFGGILKRVGTA